MHLGGLNGVAAILVPGCGNPAGFDGLMDCHLADARRLRRRSESVAYETRSRFFGTVSRNG